jgi:hypothetical protein
VNAKKWMWAILALVFLATAFAAGNVFAANTAKISNIYEDDYIVVYADEDFGARIAVNKAGDITSYCPCETGVCPAGELAVVPTATPGAGGGISKAAPTPTATPSSAVGTAPPATQQPSPTAHVVVQPSPTPEPESSPEPTEEAQLGNPGNDKPVGHAGECPNGNCSQFGWPGNGNKGASNGNKGGNGKGHH